MHVYVRQKILGEQLIWNLVRQGDKRNIYNSSIITNMIYVIKTKRYKISEC